MQVEVGQTDSQTHENPVYNKRFQFNVGNDNDRIRIFVNDSGSVRSQSIELENGIPLKDLREYMDDATIEIKELWFDFGNGSKIRIMFNYSYSKQFMYDQQCLEWRTQIEEDINDYHNIQNYLDQLQ